MVKKSNKNTMLFEVCWEVCNKVGGIYTVLTSKASRIKDIFKDNYFLIGPYFLNKAKGEFQEITPPEGLKIVFSSLLKEGIDCHYGKWVIGGEPNTILVDFNNHYPYINEIKGKLWEKYKIDSLGTQSDFNDPVLWSWCVGRLIEVIQNNHKENNIIVHCHEWLSGTALIYLDKNNTKVKKVFTTHATVLGRALSSNNYPLYDDLSSIDINKEIYAMGVAAKHQVEKISANISDILTTVSEITAMEVKYFLGRKPDQLLPNGLSLSKSLTFEDISLSHRLQRDRMREFLLYYFFPYYSFDPKKSLFYFMSGRNEFHNKGIDVFIDALAELNKLLVNNSKQDDKTIICFLWVPAGISGIRPDLREAREVFSDVEQTIEASRVTTESNLLYDIMAEKPLSIETLFEQDTLRRIKKQLLKLKKNSGLPPTSSHDFIDNNDPMLVYLKEKGLTNKKEDKVKVIIYPDYLTGSDGLLNLSYDECVQGSHLGIFPSYYEPWGYTPLETAALGVAAVTTDLAGFGRFIEPVITNKDNPGIFINRRYKKSYDESVKDLSNILYRYSQFSYDERVRNKIEASNLSRLANWDNLIENYLSIYNRLTE
ncbi:MAG: glycogen/starch synthase [Candidatus Paceibacterota bacterium]|jgi:glycogen(starch) synthase